MVDSASRVGDFVILELGCGQEPDPRANVRCDLRHVDAADIVCDLSRKTWPFADSCADGIVMRHVIEHLPDTAEAMSEISRILKPGGWAEIRVPFGALWFRDPTHQQYWMYSTPEYVANGENDWDYYYDFPLELVDRSFTTLWFTAPWLSKLSPILRIVANRFPGDWVCWTPWVAGELTIRFTKSL